jgi:hypothetical protein
MSRTTGDKTGARSSETDSSPRPEIDLAPPDQSDHPFGKAILPGARLVR